MTDKELIEMAAKAIGVCDHGEWFDSDDGSYFVVGSKLFDPLNDDGDALRLAVKLRLMVNVCPYIVIATDGNIHAEEGAGKQSDAKATRRAITRAAAQIGKEME